MAMEVGRASPNYAVVTHTPPGRQQAPNPTCFRKRNVETPYRSLRGQQTVRSAYGCAGIGTRNKRMPSCNEMDRGCNIIPRESGQTSSWSLVTREFIEPSEQKESKWTQQHKRVHLRTCHGPASTGPMSSAR